MTTETTTDLWAVHVQGPDDILPAEDRADADKLAAGINAAVAEWQKQATAPEFDVVCHAVVVPWDGTAEAHARSLARLTADGGYMHEPTTPSTTTTRSA